MLEVEYCPRCNHLFRKVSREVCPSCMIELDKLFDKMYSYIRKRENREATIDDIAENLNIHKDDIIFILRSGKLKLKSFPNLGYPCENEACNEIITEGRLCHKCMSRIQSDLYFERMRQEKEEKRRKLEKQKYRTYETF